MTHQQTQRILENQPRRVERKIFAWILLFTVAIIYADNLQQFLKYKAPEMKAKALAQKYNPNEKVDEAQRYLATLNRQHE